MIRWPIVLALFAGFLAAHPLAQVLAYVAENM